MAAKEKCSVCKGHRYVTVRLPKGAVDFKTCPACMGVGYKVVKYATC